MKKSIAIMAVSLLLTSCSVIMGPELPTKNPAPMPTPPKVAGAFAIQQMDPSASRNISIGSVEVNSSSSVFFILKNVGDFPITDVALTATEPSDNGTRNVSKSFVVTPGNIVTINSDKTSAISSLIRVDINHGQIYGLVGQSNYIDPAVTGTTIHITGNTTDSASAVIPVVIDCDLSTLIKIVKWETMYSIDDGATWNPTKTGIDPDYYNYYECIPVKDWALQNANRLLYTLKIKNTGSATFIVTNYSKTITLITLEPLEEATLDIWSVVNPANGDNRVWSISIDTLGAQYDNTSSSLAFIPGTSKLPKILVGYRQN